MNELLQAQDGVVSRQQLLALEVTDSEIERKLRRREWARVHPGVYVEHTGPLTWLQRAWAAVLFYAPAALAGPSALRAAKLRGHGQADAAPIRVCVDSARTVRSRPGITVERIGGLGIEHPGASVAPAPAARARTGVRGVCQGGRGHGRGPARRRGPARPDHRGATGRCAGGMSAAEAPTAAARDPPRCRRRRLLGPRAPLPGAGRATPRPADRKRQRRVHQGKHPAFRDVDYVDLATVVELDGRLGHEEAADRWADLDRDLSAVVAGELTLRAGWGQVLEPCRLAASWEASSSHEAGSRPCEAAPRRVRSATSLQIRHLVPEK